jgi:cytosine/adenosine deaminase-related metal-dependent hydrolase
MDVRAGLAESLRSGVTLVGDVTAGGASWPVLVGGELRAVVFHEVIGMTRPSAARAWAALLEQLRGHAATPTCRPGLSPHAPYSARAALLRTAAALAAVRRLPLTVHLAESQAELDLLAHHDGPFVPFLQEFNAWDPAGLVQSVHHALALCGPAPSVLFAHGNHLTAHCPVPAGATVVYCPRTHAHFGHPPHPFRDLLSRGVRVALGTDSRASNPDLDLLAEARFLHRRYPELSGDVLLRLATLSGAEALGWADETGSLEAGKSADLVVVPLSAEEVDPYRGLFGSDRPPQRVLFRGRWLEPSCPSIPAGRLETC